MLTPTTRTLLWLMALSLAGCSSVRKTDVLEARLRSQEDMLAVYESEMKRVKTELASTKREREDLRLQLAEGGHPIVPAEESGAAFRATGIQLSSLMTGGLDVDGKPGHDALSVVLIPHDPDGELVKLPGNIEIEALDPSHPGGAQQIGHWTFDQRDIHEFWHKGVVQSGYQFELPWQTPPQSDQVLVVAHLTTANGRRFDTTLTVKVDPPGGGLNRPQVGGVQQASAEDVNPFDVQQADGRQQAEQPPAGEIIWADGEGPAGNNPPRTKDADRKTSVRADRQPAAGSMPFSSQRAPRPRPLEASALKSSSTSAAREVPPPVEDWWSNDDWATIEANSKATGVQTSDSFTDETLPQYR